MSNNTDNTDNWTALNIADIAIVLDEINRMLTEAALKNGMLSHEPIHQVSADTKRTYTTADSTDVLLDKMWDTFYLVHDVLAEHKLIETSEE